MPSLLNSDAESPSAATTRISLGAVTAVDVDDELIICEFRDEGGRYVEHEHAFARGEETASFLKAVQDVWSAQLGPRSVLRCHDPEIPVSRIQWR